MPNTSTTRLYTYVKLLSYVGILLATYLLYSFITKPTFQPCNISASVNCDAVTKGPISTFAGIPVPLVGLVGYIVIMISAFMQWPRLVLFMSAFGALFCLRLTYIELFEIKVICPVCMTCQVVMLLIVFLGVLLNRKVPAIK